MKLNDKSGYYSLLASYELVLNWLTDLGFKIDASRLTTYKKLITNLASYHDSTELLSFEKSKWHDIVTAVYETNRLIYVYKSLFNSPITESIRPLLKQIIKGPAKYSKETISSTKPRNFLFELIIISDFVNAGIQIDVSTDADIIAATNNHDILIECKRPMNENSVIGTMKDGIDQITRKLSSNRIGLLVVSLDKVLNPTIWSNEYDNKPQFYQSLNVRCNKVIRSILLNWNKKLDDRILGFVTDVITPVSIKGSVSRFAVGRMTLVPCNT